MEKFAHHDGVRIRYLDTQSGAPKGFPIVFVPGVVDTADEYTEALGCFSDRRILVVELRGRGGSDAPATGYSVEDQTQDLEAVLRAEELHRFHLMSFSRGTTIALQVAFGHPRRALSVSIGDYLPVEVALPPQFVDVMASSSWRGTPNTQRVGRHVLAGLQADARSREFWDDLAGLGVPVLLARGSQGGFVDDSAADRYRRSVPGIEIIGIEGSEHDLFRPSRTAFPEAVREFITRRLPRT